MGQSYSLSEAPLYNIGAVVQMTGIAAATLRAWERRYGFPAVGRTAGGQRLYSDAEVVRLRWVKHHVAEGMQPSQAVRALRSAETRDGLPSLAAASDQGSGVVGPVSIASIQERLLGVLLDHDLSGADRVLQEAVAAIDPETLLLEVLAPVMEEIGERWAAGGIDVATEHLATSFLRQNVLMWMLTAPTPLTMPPVVMACAPGEMHEGSLLLLAALLRRRRVPVAYLGQATPLGDLAKLVADLRPSLVVLSASREDTAAGLTDWPQFMPEAHSTGVPIVAFGGRVFSLDPRWRDGVPGLFLGATIQEGLRAIDALLPRGV